MVEYKRSAIPVKITDETNYAGVTDTGRLKVDAAVTTSVTLVTQIYGWDKDESLWKKVLLKPYPLPTSEHGWLSIFGTVGSLTMAKNPIDFSIRKTIATLNPTPIIDKTVPTNKRWYITSIIFANDNASELQFFKGIQRSKVEYFSGNGTAVRFTLSYQAIPHGNYITVKVGGVQKVYGSDFWVEDNPTDDKKSDVVFKTAPPAGTNNIEVTYDAVERRRGCFVQASSSFLDSIPSPIRLLENEFFVALVLNKASNAAVCVLTVGGFWLNAEDEVGLIT